MHFGLNENQVILRDSAREFFAGECPMAFVRRAAESATAYDPQLWAQLAAQGYTGIIFDEAHGGVGLGIVELVLLTEEAGRALLPGPLFATVAMAGAVLDACANGAHKHQFLAPIAHGDARSTLAFVEPTSGWDRAALRLTAKNGRLSGEKLFVPDAGVANTIVVVARDGVYVVDAQAPGVSITPMAGMDLTRKLYAVSLTEVAAEKLDGFAGLDRALDVATTALVAEMVGGMQRMLDSTVDYAKTRKQFGKPIGSFQAVQHQCADMYLETESARSAVYYAAVALPCRLRSSMPATRAARWLTAPFRSTAAWVSRGRTICISITGAPRRRRRCSATPRSIANGWHGWSWTRPPRPCHPNPLDRHDWLLPRPSTSSGRP
jgi:alkylation response protein AidB-like acyl-CoA dehydrogenase